MILGHVQLCEMKVLVFRLLLLVIIQNVEQVFKQHLVVRFTNYVVLCSFKPYINLNGDSDGKECTCNAGNAGLSPGSGRSLGEGNGNPLQYSCLENPMDRGALWATVQGVAKSRTGVSD